MAEDVLRLAGLVENVNYLRQKATRSGSVPDFTFLVGAELTLHMDVKFPINAYLRYAGSGDQRDAAAFLRDVRARVRELADRDYVDPAAGTVDFVLMFIPNDQLLTFIHEQDPALLDDALRRKVVCCSPLSLFPVLQVVRQAADGLRLERNVAEVRAQLAAFGAQWSQFTRQLDGLGTHLERAQKAYDELVTTRRRGLERAVGEVGATPAATPGRTPGCARR
jgi:DNA recombination protein RmuC